MSNGFVCGGGCSSESQCWCRECPHYLDHHKCSTFKVDKLSGVGYCVECDAPEQEDPNEQHERCSGCGGERDPEGWCANYCEEA